MDFAAPQSAYAGNQPVYRRRRVWPWVVLLVIVILLGAAGVWGYRSQWWQRPLPSGWQAVFLSNGQVYFGHIVSATHKEIVLHDIYYLQGSTPLQSGDTQKASELSLVKLGNELHGPTDEMLVNRQQVLFTETLQDDSKVVKAIEQYRSSKQ